MLAAYFFNNVYIDGIQIEDNDWIGAFNGDICVGTKMLYDCFFNGICGMNIMGDNGEPYSEGYMQNGVIPTFKIYDASENIYYNAIASEECPWNYFGMCFVDSLNGFSDYQTGDINGDSITNVSDIVLLVELVLSISAGSEPTDEQLELGDIYPDGQLNVVDIVALVNIILDQ